MFCVRLAYVRSVVMRWITCMFCVLVTVQACRGQIDVFANSSCISHTMSAAAQRLHPRYTEALLRACAEGASPREAIDAIVAQSAEAFTRFFRDSIRRQRNFRITVQEIMMLDDSFAERVRAAYPEDENPGFDVREHILELVEATSVRDSVTVTETAEGETAAAAAEGGEEQVDDAKLVVNWKSTTLKGRTPNVSKWPVDTAGRMLAQMILRPKNGYAITADAILEGMSGESTQRALRRVPMPDADQRRLLELYRALSNHTREAMVDLITFLNPFLTRCVRELQLWRVAHRSVLHTIWSDPALAAPIDALMDWREPAAIVSASASGSSSVSARAS